MKYTSFVASTSTEQTWSLLISHSRRDTWLKLLGVHFLDRAVVKIGNGSTFCGTGDNWDIRILKEQLRKDVRDEDLHLFCNQPN